MSVMQRTISSDRRLPPFGSSSLSVLRRGDSVKDFRADSTQESLRFEVLGVDDAVIALSKGDLGD